jgi:Neprosin
MRLGKLASCGAAIFALMLDSVVPGSRALAQTGPTKLVPFNDFLKDVARVAPSSFFAQPASRVKTTQSFEQMRQHILSMYEGVSVRHSFLLGSDPFDCVPIMQQPSVRLRGLKSIAAEPPRPPVPRSPPPSNGPASQPMNETGQLRPGQTVDALGNSVICEDGTIPMRRITLDELSRFETLQQFFEKGPDGAGRVLTPGGQLVPPAVATHKYAFSYQNVANIGGSSDLNLWNANVNTGLQEIFSLSQQWYVNYIGSTPQTAEGGWHVYPILYGGSLNTHLFIYWTADGYNTTGCYNLTCAAFIQKNHNWMLGGVFPQTSIDGGTQYYFTLEYFLYQGNWWLNLGGQWIGYYPGTLYKGGPLATSAKLIEYGGETVGTTTWPPMGSDMLASAWWTHAAFQRNVYYISDATDAFDATLISEQPSPSCYTNLTRNNSGVGGWNTFLFFGGPGGTTC